MSEKYIRRILEANVYEVANESPLDLAPNLSQRLGSDVFLKREDQQTVFSFKLRGAFNKISKLSEQEKVNGVITASAGEPRPGGCTSGKSVRCICDHCDGSQYT